MAFQAARQRTGDCQTATTLKSEMAALYVDVLNFKKEKQTLITDHNKEIKQLKKQQPPPKVPTITKAEKKKAEKDKKDHNADLEYYESHVQSLEERIHTLTNNIFFYGFKEGV